MKSDGNIQFFRSCIKLQYKREVLSVKCDTLISSKIVENCHAAIHAFELARGGSYDRSSVLGFRTKEKHFVIDYMLHS